MNPINFLGRNVIEVLQEIRRHEVVVSYEKIEGDEYIKVPEAGFYLHAKNGTGKIYNCRIYLKSADGFMAINTQNIFDYLSFATTVDGAISVLGNPIRRISSINIPSRPKSLPGAEFKFDKFIFKIFHESDGGVVYVHIIQPEEAETHKNEYSRFHIKAG